MDELLVEIENKNELIESILEKPNSLHLEDIEKINNLYSEKKQLLNRIITLNGKNEFLMTGDENLKRKLNLYLSKDKELLDKLNGKVKLHVGLVRDSSTNKKLLIYSRV